MTFLLTICAMQTWFSYVKSYMLSIKIKIGEKKGDNKNKKTKRF